MNAHHHGSIGSDGSYEIGIVDLMKVNDIGPKRTGVSKPGAGGRARVEQLRRAIQHYSMISVKRLNPCSEHPHVYPLSGE